MCMSSDSKTVVISSDEIKPSHLNNLLDELDKLPGSKLLMLKECVITVLQERDYKMKDEPNAR